MITSRNVAFCLISSMVSGFLVQLQIFWQLSNRIAGASSSSWTTRAVALDIFKAFDKVWYADLLYKLKSYRISGQVFGLISSFLSNRWLRVVLDGEFSQEYPVNAGVPQGSTFGPTLFLLYINELLDDGVCNIAIYADDTTLRQLIRHLICGNSWNWLLNLHLTYRTLKTGAGRLISMLGKLSLFCLTCLITLVLLMWKWMGLLLRKNHL